MLLPNMKLYHKLDEKLVNAMKIDRFSANLSPEQDFREKVI